MISHEHKYRRVMVGAAIIGGRIRRVMSVGETRVVRVVKVGLLGVVLAAGLSVVVSPTPAAAAGGTLIQRSFTNAAGTRDYLLDRPASIPIPADASNSSNGSGPTISPTTRC
jgi:hypothetical protein